MRWCVSRIALGVLLGLAAATERVYGESTWEFSLTGGVVEGTPLAATTKTILLLARDGQMWKFPPDQARSRRKLSDDFASYTAGELRGRLQLEFGKQFEVTAAGEHLVVHPRGQGEQWAGHYDSLYRSFQQFMTTRGVKLSRPRFPLVAIVLPDEASFRRYMARDGVSLPPGVRGYYATFSNRIIQYDAVSDGGASDAQHLAVIIHEAAHQSAFNTGIHHRGSPPPRWVGEGLGTMFEAPGVWSPAAHPSRADRVNRGQCATFRGLLAQRPTGRLAELLASDRLFESDGRAAYAESWALMFFLCETQPRGWAAYLQATSRLDRPVDLAGAQRLREFTDIFGENLALLESQLLKFVQEL